MIKVKTFTSLSRVFHAKKGLESLDDQVTPFIPGHNVDKIISVSDACTTDDNGVIMG